MYELCSRVDYMPKSVRTFIFQIVTPLLTLYLNLLDQIRPEKYILYERFLKCHRSAQKLRILTLNLNYEI